LLLPAAPTNWADEPKTANARLLRSVLEPRIKDADLGQLPVALGQAQPGDKEKKDQKDKKEIPPLADELAQAPPTTAEAPVGFNPNMLGDLGIYSFVNVGIPVTAQVVQFIPGKPGVQSRGLPPVPPQQRIINVPTTVCTQVR